MGVSSNIGFDLAFDLAGIVIDISFVFGEEVHAADRDSAFAFATRLNLITLVLALVPIS